MTDVTTLLAGIKTRAEAATPGPWEVDSIESGEHAVFAEEHHRIGCGTSQVSGFMTKANAEFLVGARTDVPRLVAALEAVEGMHREVSQEFITASACIREECDCENECPVEPLPVCHHCWGQLEQIDPYFGEDHHVSEVMWPCPTITAVVAALGGGE